MNGAYVVAVLLADDESKKSGPIGLVVILLLCIACYFLFKSMSRHLRRVREDFPPESREGPSAPQAGSEAPGPAESPDQERIEQNGESQ